MRTQTQTPATRLLAQITAPTTHDRWTKAQEKQIRKHENTHVAKHGMCKTIMVRAQGRLWLAKLARAAFAIAGLGLVDRGVPASMFTDVFERSTSWWNVSICQIVIHICTKVAWALSAIDS